MGKEVKLNTQDLKIVDEVSAFLSRMQELLVDRESELEDWRGVVWGYMIKEFIKKYRVEEKLGVSSDDIVFDLGRRYFARKSNGYEDGEGE